MSKAQSKQEFLDLAKRVLGDNRTFITRQEVKQIIREHGIDQPNWLLNDRGLRIDRATYKLELPSARTLYTPAEHSAKADTALEQLQHHSVALPKLAPPPVTVAGTAAELVGGVKDLLIPDKFPGYVPFGHFFDIKKILSSRIFYPIYITGESGNGKSLQNKQIAAELKREFIRVGITRETSEDDLLGGYRLQNGDTVWVDGPVVIAMERGATLLLDEVDLADEKILVLQGVLEGEPIYLKKANRMVYPKEGFNVIATANTKGKGAIDAARAGRFMGTLVQNEAFLERFGITFEQDWPTANVERKILSNSLELLGHLDNDGIDFVDKLVTWAGMTRTAYDNGADEVISTRRLVHIIKAYVIFEHNRRKAIEAAISRFDKLSIKTFLDGYRALDPKLEAAQNA